MFMLVQQRDLKLRASPAPRTRRRNLTSTMPRYLRIINIQHHLQCALWVMDLARRAVWLCRAGFALWF
jgi:hypothetical protein